VSQKKVDAPVNKQVQVEHPVVNPDLNKDKARPMRLLIQILMKF
jgi:hypothetical protein